MTTQAEKKADLIEKFGGSKTNTGSTEAQIAIFTERINHISGHLKTNKKDYSAELSLVKLVGKRRSLLNYLSKKDMRDVTLLEKRLLLKKNLNRSYKEKLIQFVMMVLSQVVECISPKVFSKQLM